MTEEIIDGRVGLHDFGSDGEVGTVGVVVGGKDAFDPVSLTAVGPESYTVNGFGVKWDDAGIEVFIIPDNSATRSLPPLNPAE